MKKQTQIKLASGVLLLLSTMIIAETGFSRPGDNGNRWEYRFKKDAPTNQNPNTRNEGNTSTPINLGNDGSPCRDAFVMMSTVFDDTANGGKSRLSVPPLASGETKSFSCLDPKPVMSNTKQQKVIGGTLAVQCVNGVATLASANCTLSDPPPPPPTPTPTPSETPGDCSGICNVVVSVNYSEYQISKNATGTRKTSTVYRCENRAYKTVYESTGKVVCTPPSTQAGCGSTCDAIGVTTTSTYQISKNATGTRTSTSYRCDNGKYLVKSSSGTYCR